MHAIEARPSILPVNDEEQLPYVLYERMCVAIYAYRFGTISFLELLDRLEDILGIEPPQINKTFPDGGEQ